MKKYKNQAILGILLLVSILSFLLLPGCASTAPNPAFHAEQPASVTNPPLVVNPALNGVRDKVLAVESAVAPFNPYDIPLRGLTEGVFGVLVTIGGILAKRKNDQAIAANKAMAEGVVKANASTAVLEHVSTVAPSGVFATFAGHINDATPA